MRNCIKAITGFNDSIGRIASYLIYIGIALLFYGVLSRYIFDQYSIFAHGYSQRIFSSYFILIGAYTLIYKGHVRIDILYNKMSIKSRRFADILNHLFLLIWGIGLCVGGWSYFMRSFQLREVDSSVLSHPVYPIKFMLFLGALLISLQAISEIINTITEMREQKGKNIKTSPQDGGD